MNRTGFVLRQGGRTRRLRLTLLLLVTALVAGLASGSAAADPSTLAGETFSGASLAVVPDVCNDSGPSTFTYPLGGTAAGPASGTFSGTITVTLASPAGPVTDAQGTFTINGGEVTGEFSLIAETGSGSSCNDYFDEVVFPVVRVDALLSYTTTSPFEEQGAVPIGLVAISELSVIGLPLVFFDAGPFSPSPFDWAGFFRPVENTDADGNYIVNVVKAGQGVPVKFSLGGDKGLSIFAEGYPLSSQIACDAGAEVNTTSETVTAGGSSLGYDALTDTYSYIWKTDKAWAGTCRQLDVELADGTTHSAQFRFE